MRQVVGSSRGVLAVVMVAGLLTACGSDDSETSEGAGGTAVAGSSGASGSAGGAGQGGAGGGASGGGGARSGAAGVAGASAGQGGLGGSSGTSGQGGGSGTSGQGGAAGSGQAGGAGGAGAGGEPGTSGASGVSGAAGGSGAPGTGGSSGGSGSSGTSGASGSPGAGGVSGVSGAAGSVSGAGTAGQGGAGTDGGGKEGFGGFAGSAAGSGVAGTGGSSSGAAGKGGGQSGAGGTAGSAGAAGTGGGGGVSGGSGQGGGAGSGGGGPVGATTLAAGSNHTCAVGSSGAVRCWGRGSYGALGYGNTNYIGNSSLPVNAGDVPFGGTAVSIVAGGDHTCVVLPIGTVRCWGYGGIGLGGSTDDDNNFSEFIAGDNEKPSDVPIVQVGFPVTHLAAGGRHTCALRETFGTVRCWGDGGNGQLGYGNTNSIYYVAPQTATTVDVGDTVTQLAAGSAHTCALLKTGAVRCWGYGGYGQLGYGNTNTIGDNETPAKAGDVPVADKSVKVTQVVAGSNHTCALLDTGNVRCWGDAMYGQLGYGNTTAIGDNETPASAGDVKLGGGKVKQLAAGRAHTCAIMATGAVRCWGNTTYGQLGSATPFSIGDDETPDLVGEVNVGGQATEIVAGENHTCVRLTSGAIRCWGWGVYGALGYGNSKTIGDDETPASAGDVKVF